MLELRQVIWCVIFNVQEFVSFKADRKKLLKTELRRKNKTSTKEQQTEAAMCGAILTSITPWHSSLTRYSLLAENACRS